MTMTQVALSNVRRESSFFVTYKQLRWATERQYTLDKKRRYFKKILLRFTLLSWCEWAHRFCEIIDEICGCFVFILSPIFLIILCDCGILKVTENIFISSTFRWLWVDLRNRVVAFFFSHNRKHGIIFTLVNNNNKTKDNVMKVTLSRWFSSCQTLFPLHLIAS